VLPGVLVVSSPYPKENLVSRGYQPPAQPLWSVLHSRQHLKANPIAMQTYYILCGYPVNSRLPGLMGRFYEPFSRVKSSSCEDRPSAESTSRVTL